jgi:hypothetical protein
MEGFWGCLKRKLASEGGIKRSLLTLNIAESGAKIIEHIRKVYRFRKLSSCWKREWRVGILPKIDTSQNDRISTFFIGVIDKIKTIYAIIIRVDGKV